METSIEEEESERFKDGGYLITRSLDAEISLDILITRKDARIHFSSKNSRISKQIWV